MSSNEPYPVVAVFDNLGVAIFFAKYVVQNGVSQKEDFHWNPQLLWFRVSNFESSKFNWVIRILLDCSWEHGYFVCAVLDRVWYFDFNNAITNGVYNFHIVFMQLILSFPYQLLIGICFSWKSIHVRRSWISERFEIVKNRSCLELVDNRQRTKFYFKRFIFIYTCISRLFFAHPKVWVLF